MWAVGTPGGVGRPVRWLPSWSSPPRCCSCSSWASSSSPCGSTPTNLAEAAAQQGLSVARLQGESAQAGTAETQSVLAQLGTGVLVGPQVTATRTATTTTVVVSGHAESVVGIFSLPVRATAAGPTEPPALNAQGAGP